MDIEFDILAIGIIITPIIVIANSMLYNISDSVIVYMRV
jgi:hypothetical protein